MTVDKRALSERDICTQFITPAIQRAGWDLATQMREEVDFTAGQIIVKGRTIKRGKKKRADYTLFYKPNLPIAVVEAKDNNHSIGSGMQQALAYADEDALSVPFVFSSNGDGFLFHDKTGTSPATEQQLPLDGFPSDCRQTTAAIRSPPPLRFRSSCYLSRRFADARKAPVFQGLSFCAGFNFALRWRSFC